MTCLKFLFFTSTVSTFGGLWAMNLHLVPRDALAWGVTIFSFIGMAFAGIVHIAQLPITNK